MAPKKPTVHAKSGASKGTKKSKVIKEETAQKSRQDRDIDVKKCRCLKRKFDDFSFDMKYTLQVEGKTLDQRLTSEYQDVDRIQDGRILVLRTMYMNTKLSKLAPTEKGLKVCETLRRAIAFSILTCNATRGRDMLLDRLTMCGSINEKEFCAFLNSIINLPMLTSPSNRDHILQVLKVILFRKLNTKYPKIWEQVQYWFLSVLIADVAAYVSSSTKTALHWWYDHREQCQTFFTDLTKVDELWTEDLTRDEKDARIVNLAPTNGLMQIMFAEELKNQAARLFCKKIWDKAHELLNAKEFTEALNDEAKEWMFQQAELLLDANAGRELKYDITLPYRGLVLKKADIQDPHKHTNLMLTCVKKTLSIGRKKGLVLIWPEQVVMPVAKAVADETCPAAIQQDKLAEWNSGRNKFNRELANTQNKTGLQVVAWAKSNDDKFRKSDRSFDVEQLLMVFLRDTVGVQKLEQGILGDLPDSTHLWTYKQVEEKFEKLRASDLWQWVKSEDTGKLSVAMDLVSLAKRGCLPVERFASLTGFEAKVGDRLEWFCEHRERQNGKLTIVVTHGKKALGNMVKIALAGGDKVTGDLIANILQYKFLLKPEEILQVEKLKDVGGVQLAASSVAASSLAKENTKKPKVDKGKTALELALDATNNFFDDE